LNFTRGLNFTCGLNFASDRFKQDRQDRQDLASVSDFKVENQAPGFAFESWQYRSLDSRPQAMITDR
jgi:hypothetical protein